MQKVLHGLLRTHPQLRKGLFIFTPMLGLSIFRARNMYKNSPGAAFSLLALVLKGLCFYSKYVFWAGVYCVGPRHLLPLLPFLTLPALSASKSEVDTGVPRWKWALLILSILFQGLLVQVSFLEDQAISGQTRESAYDSWNDSAVGVPQNQYRLSYAPALSYPPGFWRGCSELTGLSEAQAPSFGLDHWYIFLYKLRAVDEKAGGKSQIPTSWIAPLLALTAFLLILSAVMIKKALRDDEDVIMGDSEAKTAS